LALVGEGFMQPFKSLAEGFLVATGLVWLLNVAALVRGGDAYLGLMYLLILLIPAVSLTYLKLKTPNRTFEDTQKWRSLLFTFQGVALAFWLYDIATTFYAINVTGLAVELNPLGWPWGIFGAMAFYAPTVCFAYFLLFKQKEKLAFFAAVPLTLLTLAMGSMNLLAGAQNFQVFVDTAFLNAGMRLGVISLLLTLNLAMLLMLKRMLTKPMGATV
jgi:hypothetical protein